MSLFPDFEYSRIFPAIDLRAGHCVRLLRGDYEQETQYSDDPVAVARDWEALGAPRLHVVDLDGARVGHQVNREAVATICASVTIPVEVSGGLRTIEDINTAIELGAKRIQLGSVAVRDPDLVSQAVAHFPEAIVVAIDIRNGEALTNGWLEGSGANP